MVAIDSSTLIAYLQGKAGEDIERLDLALIDASVTMSPVVLSEVLSEPTLSADHRALVLGIPTLDLTEGYWVRAAASRAVLLALQLRARLPDALIAQSCLDHDVALITRDRDFRHFAKHCGLKLA